MAHSLRKVFSREDKDWQESILLSRRVRSEVLPSGGYANYDNGMDDDDDDNDDDNRHRFRGHVEESIETAATITTSFDNKEDSSSSPAATADRPHTYSSTPQKPASSSPSSSSSTSFASPMTFTRAKSTNYSHYKNHPRVDESPTLAYALRKVFSRDHPENDTSSEWTAREAKGLLVPRVSSRVVEEVPFSRNEDDDGGIVAGEAEGEGAELVLESYRFGREEVYYDDVDEEEEGEEEEDSNRNPSGTASNATSSKSKKMSPIEFMNRPATKESGGYSLKRIFSNPEKQRVTASANGVARHSKPPLSPRSKNMGIMSSPVVSRNGPARSFKGKSVGYTDFHCLDDDDDNNSNNNNNNRGANGESPLFLDIEGYEVGNTDMDDAMNTHEEDSDDAGTATGAMAASSASRFGRLSKPISLIRNAKSTPHHVGRFSRTSDHANAPMTAASPKGNKLGKNHDDDISTIAESIDTSSASPSHDAHRSGRDSRRHTKGDWDGFVPMKTHWKRALIMLVVIGLCAIGIGVFLGTQKSSSNNRSNGSNGGTIQVQSTTDGNSNDMDIIFGDDDDETISNGDDNNNTILPPSDQFPNPTSSTPTESPISSPTTTPTLPPSTTPSTPPSTAPTSRPTRRPTRPPTFSPTTSPTLDTTTIFYVIADAPYSDDERENIMPRQIDTLGKDAEFLVHLGDLEYAKEDRCEEWAYESASDILNRSQVPVFVLPGDNDMNDCDDIEHGESMWRKYFRKFDQQWDHDFELTRWGNLDESFSFLHNGVLFFGINIVGGTPYSKSEAQTRHAVHLSKLKNIMKDRYHEYELVILFGHAEPASWHDDLFLGTNGLATFVEDMGKPFLHLHGDWHEWYEVESSFDVDNYLRISLDAGEFAPPIRVMIDSSKKNPVRISRRASDLDVECCRHGWPRLTDDDDDDDDDWDDDGWDDDGR